MTSLEAQRAQVADVDKPIALCRADVDESGIDAGQNVLDDSDVNVSHLVSAAGDDQLLHLIFGEDGCHSMLLGNDNLPGH